MWLEPTQSVAQKEQLVGRRQTRLAKHEALLDLDLSQSCRFDLYF